MRKKPKLIGRIETLENRVLFSGYSFSKIAAFSDGGNPADGLISDSAGDLFGLTQAGGDHNTGIVFEVAAGQTTIKTLASFPASTTGSLYPNSLVLDAAGNLFGTADRAGAHGSGSIFEIVKGSGKITTIASFDADDGSVTNNTGGYPEGNIQIDSAGNLFGTTADGGVTSAGAGGGTYWELKKGDATITPIAVFPLLTNTTGTVYASRVNFFAKDSSGDVFGLAEGNSTQGLDGYVWEIPANSSTENTLATFNGTNGADPFGPIAVDASGNVFGTTVYGGAGIVSGSTAGAGTVWEIAANSGVITDLASFNPTVGYSPDGVSRDARGDLFGTANYGGNASPAQGTAWELPTGTSTITAISSFGAPGGGAQPSGGLLIGSTGNLFGTTFTGGNANSTGNGSVFELIAAGNTPTGTAPALSPVVTKTTLPAQTVAGVSIHGSATVNITNNGTAAENGNVIVSVYASKNGVIDSASTLLGSAIKSLHTKVGKSTPVTVSIKSLPTDLEGTYTLLAQTTEKSGTTSLGTTGVTINVATAFIAFTDTVVKTTLPSAAISGQKNTATAQIKITNNGNIISTGTTTIALYISTDGTVAAGTLIRSYPTTVSLKPGKSKAITIALKMIPTVANGNYVLAAQVTDPLNNITTAISPSAVNLAAPFVSLIPSIVSTNLPATKANVTVSITNNGNVPSISTSSVSVYASTNGTVASGTLLNTALIHSGLKPAKSTKLKIAIPGFNLLSPGIYFLVLEVPGSPPVVSTVSFTVS